MFENALHLVVWIIAAIVLAGILGLTGIVVIDLTIARRVRSPMRRPILAAVLSVLVLSVGFLATALLVLHWAAASTN
jgi:hypothetical protein